MKQLIARKAGEKLLPKAGELFSRFGKDVLRTVKPDFSDAAGVVNTCLLYTSPSPRDRQKSRMPSSA